LNIIRSWKNPKQKNLPWGNSRKYPTKPNKRNFRQWSIRICYLEDSANQVWHSVRFLFHISWA